MPQLIASILDQVRPTTLLDIGITALLIYWLFSLIRGTRAVRLVIGVTVLFAVYFVARLLGLLLLTQILETGAVVGLFALVVVFQPEIRRALDRIGRVGSLGWLLSPEGRTADVVATEVARAASLLSAEGHGALIVLERETGLEEIAETGVMIHGDLSADLLRTIFTPRSALHDGAVIVRETKVLAAGSLLPLAETTVHTERFGTRHRAALGITEQTDAVVVVVSEENGQISLVQRARIVRNLNEAQLARSIRSLLQPGAERPRARDRAAPLPGAVAPRLADLGRLVRRGEASSTPEEAGAADQTARPAALTAVPEAEDERTPTSSRDVSSDGRPRDSDARPNDSDERPKEVARATGPTLALPKDEDAAAAAGPR
jgi:diadenylate cyclase